MGTLYIVATPIGNLEDITLRALKVLGQVKLVAAEDTRTTRKLISHYGLKVPMVSFHEHNRSARIPLLLEALEVGDVALVSEAGMPGVSDPGRELVWAAAQRAFPVVPLPGPSAVTAALAVSGFPASGFRFLGFLPRRSSHRRRALEEASTGAETLVFFEAPHRLRVALEDMLAVLGDRRIAVCRELTKVYEEVFRGAIADAIAHFIEPKGEFTLVVEGAAPKASEPDRDAASTELRRLKEAGLKAKEAVAKVSGQWEMSRRETYRLWLEL